MWVETVLRKKLPQTAVTVAQLIGRFRTMTL